MMTCLPDKCFFSAKTGLEMTKNAGYENTALHLLVKSKFAKGHLTNGMFVLHIYYASAIWAT
jgi:hypothetical protein